MARYKDEYEVDHYPARPVLPDFYLTPYRATMPVSADLLHLYDRGCTNARRIPRWMDGHKKVLQMPSFCYNPLRENKGV